MQRVDLTHGPYNSDQSELCSAHIWGYLSMRGKIVHRYCLNCANHIRIVTNELWILEERLKYFTIFNTLSDWERNFWWSLKLFKHTSRPKIVMKVLRSRFVYTAGAEACHFKCVQLMPTWEPSSPAQFQEFTGCQHSIFRSSFVKEVWLSYWEEMWPNFSSQIWWTGLSKMGSTSLYKISPALLYWFWNQSMFDHDALQPEAMLDYGLLLSKFVGL